LGRICRDYTTLSGIGKVSRPSNDPGCYEVTADPEHREVIVPQLAATGVESKEVRRRTGWQASSKRRTSASSSTSIGVRELGIVGLSAPRTVFDKQPEIHKVAITHPDRCIRCGACLVQCPQDALAFETPAGRRVGPEVIRRFKLNMLGKRAPGAESVAG
jgi:NAD-dependent dihydropyrimidine dehydrogenase PreA subunit